MFWCKLFWIAVQQLLIIHASKVTYIESNMDDPNKQLVEGRERGKNCRNWSRTQQDKPGSPVSLSSCYKPEEVLQPCYLERPQTRAKQMRNLVFDLQVRPNDSCATADCRLDIDLVAYRNTLKTSSTHKMSYTRFPLNENLRKVFLLQKPDEINAIYFRITPVNFCGTIQSYRVYTAACEPLTVDLTLFSKHIPGNHSEQVEGKCVENAMMQKPPTANCSIAVGKYENVIGRCVCKKGYTKNGDQCVGKENKFNDAVVK